MASSARIDELRKKFDENPRRYFAPLANEYRKAGELEQAIFICQEYLPQQPGHMSGHIVYGQALFDLNRHEEAKAVFETALSLDPENLIALRHLGDIARQAGDATNARVWYQRVLEADPRNEEIAQIMLSLLAADAPAAPAVDHNAPTPLSTPAVAALAAELAANAAATAPTDGAFHVEKSEDTTLEATADGALVQPAAAAPAPAPAAHSVEASHTSRHAPKDEDLLDLDNFDLGGVPLGTLQHSTPVPLQSDEEPAPLGESDASLSDAFEIPGSTEPEPTPEPPIEMATDVVLGLPDDGTAPSMSTGEEALSGLETFEAVSNESLADEPAASEPVEAFVTETMATLYLQQGHLESALDIYRKLVDQRPEDAGLRDRLRAVEDQIVGAAAPSAPNAQEAADIDEPFVPPTPAFGGPTIREFLSGLVSRRTPAIEEIASIDEAFHSAETPLSTAAVESFEPSTEAPPEAAAEEPMPEFSAPVAEARPTPSSSETVSGSLGVLFSGADAAASDMAAANTLAEAFAPEGPETAPLEGVPAHRASSELSLNHVFKGGSPQRSDGDGFSFDQFFAENAAEDAPPPSDTPAGGTPEATDDIAQFNAWLNGLKKT